LTETWQSGSKIEEGVIEEYEGIGDRNYLVALLGEAALNKSRLGRPEEALEIVANARRIGSVEDIGDQIRLDLAEAHARARHGEQTAARSCSNPRGSGQREPA
jgi:hypothetical protein